MVSAKSCMDYGGSKANEQLSDFILLSVDTFIAGTSDTIVCLSSILSNENFRCYIQIFLEQFNSLSPTASQIGCQILTQSFDEAKFIYSIIK